MNAEYYFEQGQAKADSGDYQGALLDFSEVLALQPNHVRAAYQRGIIFVKIRNYEQAIHDFSHVLMLVPSSVLPYFYRGISRSMLGDRQGAIDDWSRVIELAPDYPKGYGNRAIVRAELGDNDGAISDWSQFIRLHPNEARAFANRGVIHAVVGNYQEAIKDYECALRIDPQSIEKFVTFLSRHHFSEAYYQRGTQQLTQKDYEGAIRDYAKAITIGLDSVGRAKVLVALGAAHAALGRKSKAIKDYQEAARLFTLVDQAKHETVLKVIEGIRANLPKTQEELGTEKFIEQLGESVSEALPILRNLYARGILDARSRENNLSVSESLLQILTLPRAAGLSNVDIFWAVLERLFNPYTNTQIVNVPFANGKTKANTCVSAASISSLIVDAGEYARIIQEITDQKMCFTVTRRYDDSKLFQAKVMWLEKRFSFQVVGEQTLLIHVVPDVNALGRAILENENRRYPEYNFGQLEYKNSRGAIDVLLQSAITNYALGGNYDSSTDTDKTDQTSGVPTESFGALSIDYDILRNHTALVRGPAATDENWIAKESVITSPIQAYDSPS